MSILVNKHSRVMTQGIDAQAGAFHTRACRGYGHGRKCFVAAVNPGQSGGSADGIPVFGSVREARAGTGATVSVIYAPPELAAAAIDEAVDAELDLVVCITAGIPARDMVRTLGRLKGRRTLLLGPDCPGLITPDEIKIGIVPCDVHQRGRIGVVSRSGTLAYEAVSQLKGFGLGQSTVVGIGSDPLGGLQLLDVLKMFNEDPCTDAVIMLGELGGVDEEPCARWIREHMHKPVVGFVAGAAAGAEPPGGSPQAAGAEQKLALMQACGIHVTRHPAEIGRLLASLVMPDYLPFD
jgi:succinyl-CoA synthetase alpha subunit